MASSERWYFTREQINNNPNRKIGLDADKELCYRQQAANYIQEMGQKLSVTQLCINTAIVYMHRFYMFHTFQRFHRNSIAQCAIFLAAKVEEQPRKLEHVIRIAQILMNPNKDIAPLDTKSEQYMEWAHEVVTNENIMLQTLGFDIAIEHPHTYVVKCCQLVGASKDLAQTSYFMATNSLHLTTMCLQYKPTVVACVCIYLASKWSNWKIQPSKEGREWFYYIDTSVTIKDLEEMTSEFLNTIEKSPSRLRRNVSKLMSGKSSNHHEPSSEKRPRPELAHAPSLQPRPEPQQRVEERAPRTEPLAAHSYAESQPCEPSTSKKPVSLATYREMREKHHAPLKPESHYHQQQPIPPHKQHADATKQREMKLNPSSNAPNMVPHHPLKHKYHPSNPKQEDYIRKHVKSMQPPSHEGSPYCNEAKRPMVKGENSQGNDLSRPSQSQPYFDIPKHHHHSHHQSVTGTSASVISNTLNQNKDHDSKNHHHVNNSKPIKYTTQPKPPPPSLSIPPAPSIEEVKPHNPPPPPPHRYLSENHVKVKMDSSEVLQAPSIAPPPSLPPPQLLPSAPVAQQSFVPPAPLPVVSKEEYAMHPPAAPLTLPKEEPSVVNSTYKEHHSSLSSIRNFSPAPAAATFKEEEKESRHALERHANSISNTVSDLERKTNSIDKVNDSSYSSSKEKKEKHRHKHLSNSSSADKYLAQSSTNSTNSIATPGIKMVIPKIKLPPESPKEGLKLKIPKNKITNPEPPPSNSLKLVIPKNRIKVSSHNSSHKSEFRKRDRSPQEYHKGGRDSEKPPKQPKVDKNYHHSNSEHHHRDKSQYYQQQHHQKSLAQSFHQQPSLYAKAPPLPKEPPPPTPPPPPPSLE